jgi:hypothetical protein
MTKKVIIYLSFSLFINPGLLSASSFVPADSMINEGPHFFFSEKGLRAVWIEKSVLLQKIVTSENFDDFNKRFRLPVEYDDLKKVSLLRPVPKQNYTHADSIGVISDIHGGYKTYLNLMKASGVIDENLRWNFGRGHFVVLGDMLDRGDGVTEVLWHLFGLERQAEKAGGKVHIMLGNHEFMVLSRELSYINEKYKEAQKITGLMYYDEFSERSVLGKWLRSKPVMITIDQIIFIHAGISTDLIRRNLTMEQINRKFSNHILGYDPAAFSVDEELCFLDGDSGPLWYRGYFSDTTFCESKIDSVLNFYGKKNIVVGHTINNGINSLFNNKIIGVDTGIMYNRSPEMLIYKNGAFYRSNLSGKRTKL